MERNGDILLYVYGPPNNLSWLTGLELVQWPNYPTCLLFRVLQCSGLCFRIIRPLPDTPHMYIPHSLTHTPHTPSHTHPHIHPTLPHTERRHTVCYTTHKYPASAPTSRRSHDDGSDPAHLCYPETKADIQRALKGGSGKHTSCIWVTNIPGTVTSDWPMC